MTGPTGMASESVPELSVVLCTLNGERTIAAQLCALAAQVTESSFETIVVDNGSTDRTAAIVRKFIGGPRPVRLVAAPDRPNLSYARNVGVDAARGDAVAFCDDDDIVDERWVDGLVEALRSCPYVASSMEYTRLNPASLRRGRQLFQSTQIEEMFGLPITNGVIAIDRSIWNRVGGNDENFGGTGEDFDFSLRVFEHTGIAPTLATGAIYHYRLRAGGRDTFRQMRRFGASHAQLYARHGRGRVDLRAHAIDAIGNWWWIATRAPLALRADRRENWSRQAGRRVGRLVGSVRHRVFYP